jgi:SsrA-binding protein
VISKLEAGIMLYGWEVKSMKAGNVNFRNAFITYTPQQELMLQGGLIASWKSAPPVSAEAEKRDRKLLVRKSEALKVGEYSKRPGHTLVPIDAYINDKGLIKLTIALVKGRRQFEKKQKIKERDMKRQIDKDLR